jgi:hypothetical protein
VISFSDLGSDPRVDRQIAALRSRYDVVAAGLGAPAYDDVDFIDISTPERTAGGRVVGLSRLLARRYDNVYWQHPRNVAVLEQLRNVRPDAVLANELEALPIGLRLGPPVVFDAHEYYPGEFGERRWWRTVIAPYVRWLCRRYIPQCAAMTTVGQAIADAYARETGVRATVVTNAPPRADLEPTPPHEPVRILHHGVAQRGRGLEEMIRLGDLLDERFTLDFVLVEGTPGYRDELVRQARHNSRVRFPPPRPMQALVRMANEYDIGLFLLPPVNLSRRYALPNKFFEFIQARLAVAIGPSPEMARLVREFDCGIVADDFTPEALAAALGGLTRAAIAAYKSASDAAAGELCAEKNAELVLDAVERALARGPERAVP